jgi:metal-responsive CopG/Arc/MetJ family transcriptional regulator
VKKSSASETTRLTISLPTALVRKLDERLVPGDSSRAAAIRRLIEAALREIETREEREQYIRGWLEQPQTEEEFGWMTSPAALEHLAEIPWESDAEPSGGPTSRSHGDADRSS